MLHDENTLLRIGTWMKTRGQEGYSEMILHIQRNMVGGFFLANLVKSRPKVATSTEYNAPVFKISELSIVLVIRNHFKTTLILKKTSDEKLSEICLRKKRLNEI